MKIKYFGRQRVVISMAFAVAACIVLPRANESLAGDQQAPSSISSATLKSEIDSMVADLLARTSPNTRGQGTAVPLAFDGVAWETGEGVSAGTSRFGTQLNEAILASLAGRGVTAEMEGVTGRGLGLGKILKGGFKVLKTGAELSLSVVDAGTGNILSSATKILSGEPSGALGAVNVEDLLPPGSDSLKKLARLLQEVVQETDASLDLRLTTNRGNQAAFFVGERLQVLVEGDRDFYLRLYHVTGGDQTTMTLIYPNQGEGNSLIPARTKKIIPGENSGVAFEVSEPAGVDAIVAIASETPFGDDSQVASGLDPGADNAFFSQSRGLTRMGPYLVAQGLSDEGAKSILSRGLIVVPADGSTSNMPDQGWAEQGEDNSSLSRTSQVTRKACFYTTLTQAPN